MMPAAQILQSLQKATELKPDSYKAWHAWALMNFTALSHMHKAAPSRQGRPT